MRERDSDPSDQAGLKLSKLKKDKENIQKELNGLYETLEDRVERRTHDLARIRTELENEIAERKKAEETLRMRFSLERMVAQIASLAMETDDINVFLDTCLSCMGNTLDIGRIYIYRFDPKDSTVSNTHEWTAPGISPEKENLQNIPENFYPWWAGQLRQRRIIDCENVDQIEGQKEKKILHRRNIKSVLAVPLFSGETYYGYMGFDECRSHRKWEPENIEILKTVGFLIEKYIQTKETEQALRISEKKYRSVVERSNEGILIVGPEGVLFANRRHAQIFGTTVDQLLRYELYDGIYPEDLPYVRDLFLKGMNGDKMPEKPVQARAVREDGQVIQVEVKAEVIEYGGNSAMLVLMRDITEEKKNMNALMQSEHRYRLLAENLLDGIFVARVNPVQILYVNKSMEIITGYTAKELFATKEKHLRRSLMPEDLNMLEHNFMAVIPDSNAPVRYEHRFVKKDGACIWISVSASSIVYEGEPAFLCTMSDISDRKQLESQLRQSQKMEAIGTLAGGIAHDFNNILTGILGYAEIGKMEIPENTPGKEKLDKVIQCGYKARDLVKQILTFSRQHEPELKPTKISAIVMDSAKLLKSTLPSFIEIAVNIKDASVIIAADSIQIHQLMLNLCTNAAHAMEENGGRLDIAVHPVFIDPNRTQVHPDLTAGSYVNLKIADTGQGMAPEVLEHIFEPYFTTKQIGKGTGLGLATVHGIVESHRGAIMVRSTPGIGTVFDIYFPELKQEVVSVPPKPPAELQGGTGRIMAVDDEEDLVTVIRHILAHYGYQVTEFTDPLEALDCFTKDPGEFDLVISDMTMPRLTGDKLAKALMEIRPDIPVVLCSGYSEKLSHVKPSELGIRAILQKPLGVEELLEVVKNAIEPQKRPSTGTLAGS